MALIVSAQSGNFNAASTWVGGVIPTIGDEAQASNGHTITITANTSCDELSNSGSGIFSLSSGVTLTANITSKTLNASTSVLIYNAASSASIVGNITGGLPNQSRGITVSGTGTLNITGNCTGGVGNSVTHAVLNSSTGTINITGNCTGGAGAQATAVNNSSTGTINITGNCIGGPNATGVINGSTGTMTIIGGIFASEFAAGIGGGARGQVTLLTGPFYTSTTFGVSPNAALAWRWATTLNPNTFIEVPTSNLAQRRNFVTPDNATNFPSAANVRSGTTYGIGGALVGTCAIPPASSVASGVPVDNTVGTATLTAADLWNHLTTNITTSGSIGERLKNAATIDIVGQEVADALTA